MSALTFELKARPIRGSISRRSSPSGSTDSSPRRSKRSRSAPRAYRSPSATCFKVKGKDASELRFAGTDGRCDKIGAGMTKGAIVVDGDAGAYLGAGMKQRQDRGQRQCRRFGRRQHGRRQHRHRGRCRRAGRRHPVGETLGMRGGVLTIGGNAGSLVGERMRRGLVIVGGDAGDYAGGRMVAGTILFKRRVGAQCRFWPCAAAP